MREPEVRIRLRLNAPPSEATFFLPGPWAGQTTFDAQVTLDEARGPAGSLPMHLDREVGRVDVQCGDVAWMELSYRVRTAPPDRSASRFHPTRGHTQVFAYAPTIFVLPSEGLARQVRDIPVEVRAPQGWQVGATWHQHSATLPSAHQPGSITGFIAEDVRTLRDAFILAGSELTSASRALPNGDLKVLQSPTLRFDVGSVADDTRSLLSAYIQRFGVYQSAVAAVLESVDSEHSGTLQGMGRRGGFVVQVPRHQRPGAELLLLIAHEALHMWNGHELVPAPSADIETRWFKEGLTHYLALKTLARQGLIDQRDALRELASAAQHYTQNPLAHGAPADALDQERFPYDRGVLIALRLDLALHLASRGEIELEDWLVQLLKPHLRAPARSYDTALLERAFREISIDLSPAPTSEFRRLVRDQAQLQPRRLFSELGLHWLDPTATRPARLLPIDGEPSHFRALFAPPHSS
ncbi:hypothetical protein [Lujinxingia litoralis]|uniref:M61 family metallopeptidase n=1 Tax=Lujinxingia litoralis TaxID=2211119 RepID=UPI001314F846|nr:hypothetical protein [Lujinxingia litoralis]